ncbi:MAG: peptidase M28 family protein, partial [Chitinophagaceae bacterium]|nr:peptidase M28 family protein [Chitinophagaceae bacterium]
MKIRLTAIILFVLTNSILAQQSKEDSLFIRSIANEILTNGKVYDNLRVLTKDIGGRLAGSPGMVKAERWGIDLMKESGAENAWLQECMVPHWVR